MTCRWNFFEWFLQAYRNEHSSIMSKASQNKKHAHLFGLNDPLSATNSSTPTNDDPLSRSASPSSSHTSDPLSFLSRRGQSHNAGPHSPLFEDTDQPRPASSVSYASRRGSSGSSSSGSSTPVPASSVSTMPTSRASKGGNSSSSIFGDIDVTKLGGGGIFGKKPQLKLRSRLDYHADEEDIFSGSSRRRPAANSNNPGSQPNKSPSSSRPGTPASIGNSDEERMIKQERDHNPIAIPAVRENQENNASLSKSRHQTANKPVPAVNNSQPANNQADSAKATTPPRSTPPIAHAPSSPSTQPKVSPKTSSSIFASAASNIARARSPKASPKPAESVTSNEPVSPPVVEKEAPMPAPVQAAVQAPAPIVISPPETESTARSLGLGVNNDYSFTDTLSNKATTDSSEQISQTSMFDEDPETVAFRNDMSFSITPVMPNTTYLDPMEPFPPSNDDLHPNIIPQHTVNSDGAADIDDPWQSSIIPIKTTIHTPSIVKPTPDFDLSAFQPMDEGRRTSDNLKISSSSIPENKRNAFSDLISNWNSGSVGQMEFITDPAYQQDDTEFYRRVASQQSDVGFKGIEDQADTNSSGYSHSYHHTLPDRLGDLSLSENPWS